MVTAIKIIIKREDESLSRVNVTVCRACMLCIAFVYVHVVCVCERVRRAAHSHTRTTRRNGGILVM